MNLTLAITTFGRLTNQLLNEDEFFFFLTHVLCFTQLIPDGGTVFPLICVSCKFEIQFTYTHLDDKFQ